jgi:inosose dehydratase
MQFMIGCQTYSWEMLGDKWQGTPDDILNAIATAGYTGVEFSNNMIGSYLEQPQKFEKALENRGLQCAAFAYARNGFTDPKEFMTDLEGLEKALKFTAHFGVVLGLGGPSNTSRLDLENKLEQAFTFYQEAARRAEKYKVTLAVHPHSHHTSLAITSEEYQRLLEATEPFGIYFNPDTGHILRGGQDLMECLHRYRERIVHVHIKDVNVQNEWTLLGKGITPLSEVLHWLDSISFAGWVVIEEESEGARKDITGAITDNRLYMKGFGY